LDFAIEITELTL